MRALLALALARAWAQLGGTDVGMLARTEELAMRALETDPSLADAHHAIGFVRMQSGELAAAIRAEQECLRLAPLHADAHYVLGSLLCDSLHVGEGLRRLELAARLEPRNASVTLRRMTVYALLGEEARARELLAATAAAHGPASTVLFETYAAYWWRDVAMAERVADLVEEIAAGAAWGLAGKLLRSFARGELDPQVERVLAELTSARVGQRHRSMMHQRAAEYFALWKQRRELALGHIDAVARLPAFTDLLWMDRCPTLAAVRDDPRFAEARAVVAARAVDLWGAVG